MATFKMVLKSEVRTEIKSKQVNNSKLNWFLVELENYHILRSSESFIKIYISNRKQYQFFLTEDEVTELALKWINYKESKITK